eukprot:scaffold19707_cov177-Skeletonema_marinoi.AAC.1
MVNLEMRSISIRAPHDDAKMRLGDGNTSSVMWSSSELGQDHRGLTRSMYYRSCKLTGPGDHDALICDALSE